MLCILYYVMDPMLIQLASIIYNRNRSQKGQILSYEILAICKFYMKIKT